MKKISLAVVILIIMVFACACGSNNKSDLEKENEALRQQLALQEENQSLKQQLEQQQANASAEIIGQNNDTTTSDIPVSTPTDVATPTATPTPEIIKQEVPIDPIASTDYELQLDINYESNIAMAKYTINVYLDGEQVASLANGEYYLDSVKTTNGRHTLEFTKRGDGSIAVSKTIDVSGNTTFKCNLKSHTTYIEMTNVNVMDYKEDTTRVVPDLTEMRLDDAISKLRQEGFVKIYVVSNNGKAILQYSNWVVVDQNVLPGSVIEKTDEIELICEKDG